MTDTNQMQIHFDHAAIERDFTIYEIERDSGNYYRSRLPDVALQQCRALAVAYDYGTKCYVLYNRSAAGKYALKQALERCEDDFRIREIASQQLAADEKHRLAQLLCNAIPSLDAKDAMFHNITGKLYYQDSHWVRQRKNMLISFWALEISFTRDCCIKMSVKTFRNACLNPQDADKPQYLFDPKSYVLRRALNEERREKGDRFVLGALNPKRKNTVPFLAFGSFSEYQLCKVGILQRFLRDVQHFLSPYLKLTPISLDESRQNGAAHPADSTKDIRQRIHDVRLCWEDTVQNEQSAALLAMLQQELLQYSGVTLVDGTPKKGDALLRIVHNQAYYEDCPEQDPYGKAPKDCIVQHITVEDFQLTGKNKRGTREKEDYNLRKVLQELAIKIDIQQRRMECYDWSALGFSTPVTFVIATSKDKKPDCFYALRVHPSGELSFESWAQSLLWDSAEHEKIAQAFSHSNGNFNNSVRGLIFEDEDNIHVIYDTERYTLPNMNTLEQLLKATQDDEQLPAQPIINAMQEYTVSASDMERDRCEAMIGAIRQFGACASRKQFRQLLNTKTKLGRQLNSFIFDQTGILIASTPKDRQNRGNLFNGTLGIRHFHEGNAQYYYSGYIEKSLNRSLPHACRIRKICSTGQKLHFERYLSLLEVDFVRASGWTVIPFPFKYLREWAAQQH